MLGSVSPVSSEHLAPSTLLSISAKLPKTVHSSQWRTEGPRRAGLGSLTAPRFQKNGH